MIIIVLLHMVRVFISGSYKKPREIQWLAGVGLLVLLFALAFSGTVLKWDQEAVEALGHQVEVSEMIGSVGSLFTAQFAPGVPLLTRLYAAHVTMIPIVALPLAILHLVLIRILGVSAPVLRRENGDNDSNKSLPKAGRKAADVSPIATVTFASHAKRMLAYGTGAVAIAIILSLAFPAGLTMRGIEGIEITKPPWYLLWIFPLENTLGLGAIPAISIIIAVALAAVPLVDRKVDTEPRRRRAVMIGMFLLLSVFVGLMIAGALVPIAGHL